MRPSVDLRDDFRVDLSSRREEFVSADIRAFFHSIYTHAIPWAIHGKAWSKAASNRGPEHYGNLIDLLCRNMQDGQTVGLPVGPDTSRLIAEVVASAIDVELKGRLNVTSRDASRYIDDYTISSANGQTGESLIAALRQAAALFELELNNDKSAIYPTSMRQNTGWKQAVRAQIPRGNLNAAAFQQFFYQIGRICESHPDINVEKYALQNARSALVSADDWRKIQSHLINAYRRNSTLISFLVEILILRNVEKGDVDGENIRDFLQHRIPVLARANRTGEIIWLLFLAIRLDLNIPSACVAPLFEMENAFIALLIAYANTRQLVQGSTDFRIWNRSLAGDKLKGGMWLYAYESVVAGFNPGVSAAFIQEDPFFSLLYAKRVRFLAIDNGFTSIAATLRNRRNDNSRMMRLREDFFDDFSFELSEFDDVHEEDGAFVEGY